MADTHEFHLPAPQSDSLEGKIIYLARITENIEYPLQEPTKFRYKRKSAHHLHMQNVTGAATISLKLLFGSFRPKFHDDTSI